MDFFNKQVIEPKNLNIKLPWTEKYRPKILMIYYD